MNQILITVFLLLGLAFSSYAFKFDIKPLHLASVVQEDPYATQSSAQGIPNQAYNITNYQFIGPSYFNSPKPLNLTFEDFYDKDSGFHNYSTTWKVNKTLSYSIKGIETIYNYSSNGQYARLFPANNEIMVSNGSANLTVNFYWQKIDNGNRILGWGTAETTSSEISYIVKLVPNKNNPDFIDENVTEYYPLKFRQMVFTKIDSNITDEDKKNVLALLNDVDTTDSVKDLIEKDINSRYPSKLNQHINYGYYKQDYQYVKSYQSTVTLNFVDAPCFFNFTKQGIAYGFRLVNSSFPEFEYSAIEPERLNPKIYGQRQQFTSFSHYRNFIWMAIKLNATMNLFAQDQTSTVDFHYYVGELKGVLSNIQNFKDNWQVKALCSGEDYIQSINQITVTQATNSTFYVDMGWGCTLYAGNQNLQPIARFNVTGRLEVMGYPQPDTLDFWAKDFTLKTISVDDSLGYKLLDKAKAESIIKKAATSLYTKRLIGSGWGNILGFEKGKFFVTKTGTYVTDPSFQPAAVMNS